MRYLYLAISILGILLFLTIGVMLPVTAGESTPTLPSVLSDAMSSPPPFLYETQVPCATPAFSTDPQITATPDLRWCDEWIAYPTPTPISQAGENDTTSQLSDNFIRAFELNIEAILRELYRD